MNGSVIVVGLVTGIHIIEDINFTVPHKVAVHIPADDALKSKDLWRGIQQNFLFKLDGGAFHGEPVAPDARLVENALLEQENKRLRQELEAERTRNQGLQDLLSGLQSQLQGVHAVLGRLESGGPRTVSVSRAREEASGAVGGEVPMFIDTTPTETPDIQISTTKETSDASSISSAASRLRAMRNKPAPT